MSATNERTVERPAKARTRERPADLYDPHFPAKRRRTPADGEVLFDPHFPRVPRH